MHIRYAILAKLDKKGFLKQIILQPTEKNESFLAAHVDEYKAPASGPLYFIDRSVSVKVKKAFAKAKELKIGERYFFIKDDIYTLKHKWKHVPNKAANGTMCLAISLPKYSVITRYTVTCNGEKSDSKIKLDAINKCLVIYAEVISSESASFSIKCKFQVNKENFYKLKDSYSEKTKDDVDCWQSHLVEDEQQDIDTVQEFLFKPLSAPLKYQHAESSNALPNTLTPHNQEVFSAFSMPDQKKINTVEGQVVLFNRNLSNVMVTLRQQMAKVIARPAEFGLQPNGLSVALIRAQQEKKNESVLVKEIKKISAKTLGLSLNETFNNGDNVLNGFNALHWGAAFNNSEVVQYLLGRGFEGQLIQRNSIGLTPMQMAVVAGSRTCFMSRFASIPEFSEIDIHYINEQNEKLKFTFNELHLALISQQIDIVRDIFATLKTHHKNIQTEIKGIGNLLHLLVYIGNSQVQQEPVSVDIENTSDSSFAKIDAVNLLQLILQQGFSKKILIKLLIESSNNHEGYSPLSLAAKYGQVGLLHALINYLKLYVKESNGLEEVIKAFYVAAQHGQNEVVEFLIHFYQFKPSNTHAQYSITIDTLKTKAQTEPHYQLILGLIQTAEKTAGHQQYIEPKSGEQSYENLVLSGGGGKGFIYPYALQALEVCLQRRSESTSHDFIAQSLSMNTIVRVAGTSAGAMFAFALALGYTPKELEAKLDTNFAEFLESDHIEQVTQQLQAENPNNDQILTSVLRQLNLQVEKLRALVSNVAESSHPILKSTFEFIKHPIALYNEVTAALAELKKLNQQFNGFNKGEKAYVFLRQLLLDKGLSPDLTFGELAQLISEDANKQKGYKHLHVAVTNLTQSLFEVLSTENPLYKNYLILDAVRASMSYPLVFMPHHLKIKESSQIKTLADEYIDGGALRNYPIDEFDFKQYTDTDHIGDPKYLELNKKTLGFRFADHSTVTTQLQQPNSETLLSRFIEFVSLYSQAETLIGAHIDREYHRSIVLDMGAITTFTFKKLTDEDKRFLKQQIGRAHV